MKRYPEEGKICKNCGYAYYRFDNCCQNPRFEYSAEEKLALVKEKLEEVLKFIKENNDSSM